MAARKSRKPRVCTSFNTLITLPLAVDFLLESEVSFYAYKGFSIILGDDLFSARTVSRLSLVCKDWKDILDDDPIWKTIWQNWYSQLMKNISRNTFSVFEFNTRHYIVFHAEDNKRYFKNQNSQNNRIDHNSHTIFRGWCNSRLPPVLRCFKSSKVEISEDGRRILKGFKSAFKTMVVNSCRSCRIFPCKTVNLDKFFTDIECSPYGFVLHSATDAIELRENGRHPRKTKSIYRDYAEPSELEEKRIQSYEDFLTGKSKYVVGFKGLCYWCSKPGTNAFYSAHISPIFAKHALHLTSTELKDLPLIKHGTAEYLLARDVTNRAIMKRPKEFKQLIALLVKAKDKGACQYCKCCHDSL